MANVLKFGLPVPLISKFSVSVPMAYRKLPSAFSYLYSFGVYKRKLVKKSTYTNEGALVLTLNVQKEIYYVFSPFNSSNEAWSSGLNGVAVRISSCFTVMS